jgi:hypothetical protein
MAALDALIATYTAGDPPASEADGKACGAGDGGVPCENQAGAGGSSSRAFVKAVEQNLAGDASVLDGVCSFTAAAVPKQQRLRAAVDSQQGDGTGGSTHATQQAVAAATQRMNPFAIEDELLISPAVFAALQDALVTPCTIDACASQDGSNALLPDYCCVG